MNPEQLKILLDLFEEFEAWLLESAGEMKEDLITYLETGVIPDTIKEYIKGESDE